MTKKRKKSHECTVGEYWHDCSSTQQFKRNSQRDGLGDIAVLYDFCPYCGKSLKEKQKKMGLIQ